MARQLGIEEVDLPDQYNIAPTSIVLAVVADPKPRWTMLRWGLVPGWAKDIEIGNRLINARCETIAEKPSFRSAFRRRRCLIPAAGYYEWLRSGNTRDPWFYCLSDGTEMALAGIWEHWQSPDGSEIETFALITTAANALAAEVHHRMPVILHPEDWRLWLDHSTEDIRNQLPLLKPYDGDDFTGFRVSRKVNSVRNDGPDLIEPVSDTPDLFAGME